MPSRKPIARTIRAILVAAVSLALLGGLAACSAGGSGATVRVLAGEGTVEGSVISGDRRVGPGDFIEVSGADALVEIQWADGSFTRLSDGSSFEIGAPEARGLLKGGTAWNAVAPATTGFAITTADGTVVADAGSTFAVRCDDVCDGVAATGAVDADGETVTAPATFVIGESGSSPAGWDTVYADEFAIINSARDESAGFPAAAQSWDGRDPGLASMTGVFSGPDEIITQSCTGWPEECARVEANIFPGFGEVEFTFDSDCAGTLPCEVTSILQINLSSGGSEDRPIALLFDGSAFELSEVLTEDYYCIKPDGTTEGRWINTIANGFIPTAAEVRDGVYVVTALRVESASDVTRAEGTTDPSCAEFEYEWVDERAADLTLVSSTAVAPDAAAIAGLDIPPLRPTTGLASPSVLSDLRSPAEAIPSLGQLGVLGATIIVLVLILGYPAYLLSRVVSDRYDDVVQRRGGPKERAPHPVRRAFLLILGVIVASLITAALDPGFGAPLAGIVTNPASIGTAVTAFAGDLGSWRLVLTALASFILFLGIGSLVVRLVGRSVAPGVAMPLQFRWGSLLILLAGVVLSRVFDINPGIIFGLVAGLVIADSLPIAARGRIMLATALFAFVVGVGAWIGYGILAPMAAGDPTNVVLVTSTEVLSALTLEAICALPLAFLPVAGLDGGVLRRWKFVIWALVYAVGLALFLLVLFTMPGSFAEIQVEDAIRWGIGFGAFSVVAIVIWLIHDGVRRRQAKREGTEMADPQYKRSPTEP